MFLSVSPSLLSFIKPPHRLALSFFALGACRRCSALPLSAPSRIGLLRFILAVSSLRCLLNFAFFFFFSTFAQRTRLALLATLIGARARSISRLTCQLSFSRYISRLSTSRQQFHNHHGGEISGFRSSFPSFLFPFTRYNFASWRAERFALTTNDCSVVLHPPSSMSFCFFIHRCPPLFLPLSFRFTSAVRAST